MDSNGKNHATELLLAVATGEAPTNPQDDGETGGAWRDPQDDGEWELESPTLKLLAQRLRLYRAPVGQWARASDEMIWGLWSNVRMTASVANNNGMKWPVTVRRASVLVCLFEGAAGELRVILTRRAGRLSSHSGEVALPGGKRDEEDEDDIATALREAKEEIGLEPSQVRVVAAFEPFLSKDEAHRYEDLSFRKVVFRVHFFDFESPAGVKYSIWGLTAAVLIRAASIILQCEPAFIEVPAFIEAPPCLEDFSIREVDL
ncbi:hypothetical protein BDL97_18G012400 [Sphagnum fallax]|nr:hypothetical protein BDL97_18G012400 [Sphagnum fallax]